MNKFSLVRNTLIKKGLLGSDSKSNLLDAGCRGCELKPYVEDLVSYSGLDLFQNKDNSVTFVGDIAGGVPKPDRYFDYVVAMDLVEHVDDFQGCLNELLRVSNKSLIIMLPNMGHIFFRFKFFIRGQFSGKYDITYGAGQDRHRWVTTQVQCDLYMAEFAKENCLKVDTIWFCDSRKKILFSKMCRFFCIRPNVWAWATYYVFDRD